MNDLVKDAIDYISDLFHDNADGHDAEHALRVYNNALKISEGYPEADIFIVSLAAILHDADDHKLFDHENNENAREFMASHDIDEKLTDRICDIINSVSFSKNRGKKPDNIEACIVQDADRLDALGAIGIARTFAYGGKHGRSLDNSVQHFYDKLLVLKDELNTDKAWEIADRRHRFLELFLEEWNDENSEIV